MRVVVFGGRDFTDRKFLFRELDSLNKVYNFTLVIEGQARGADRMSREWAQERGIRYKEFPANWSKHGRSAGFMRNQQMIDEGKPELAVAFDTGGPGTRDMVSRVVRAGIKHVINDCRPKAGTDLRLL